MILGYSKNESDLQTFKKEYLSAYKPINKSKQYFITMYHKGIQIIDPITNRATFKQIPNRLNKKSVYSLFINEETFINSKNSKQASLLTIEATHIISYAMIVQEPVMPAGIYKVDNVTTVSNAIIKLMIHLNKINILI